MKLDIGCGEYPREGYEGVDVYPYEGVKHVCDIRGTLPFADNSVEAISSSHFLEHLTDVEGLHLVQECYRVLQPGGVIEVVVPDFPQLLESFLKMDWQQQWTWGIRTIFGMQHTEGEYHKTGYDSDKLAALFEHVGFLVTETEKVWTHNQPSLKILARKTA